MALEKTFERWQGALSMRMIVVFLQFSFSASRYSINLSMYRRIVSELLLPRLQVQKSEPVLEQPAINETAYIRSLKTTILCLPRNCQEYFRWSVLLMMLSSMLITSFPVLRAQIIARAASLRFSLFSCLFIAVVIGYTLLYVILNPCLRNDTTRDLLIGFS